MEKSALSNEWNCGHSLIIKKITTKFLYKIPRDQFVDNHIYYIPINALADLIILLWVLLSDGFIALTNLESTYKKGNTLFWCRCLLLSREGSFDLHDYASRENATDFFTANSLVYILHPLSTDVFSYIKAYNCGLQRFRLPFDFSINYYVIMIQSCSVCLFQQIPNGCICSHLQQHWKVSKCYCK